MKEQAVIKIFGHQLQEILAVLRSLFVQLYQHCAVFSFDLHISAVWRIVLRIDSRAEGDGAHQKNEQFDRV